MCFAVSHFFWQWFPPYWLYRHKTVVLWKVSDKSMSEALILIHPGCVIALQKMLLSFSVVFWLKSSSAVAVLEGGIKARNSRWIPGLRLQLLTVLSMLFTASRQVVTDESQSGSGQNFMWCSKTSVDARFKSSRPHFGSMKPKSFFVAPIVDH